MDSSQSEQTLSCPRCGQSLRRATAHERITVHSCLPCRGVWLDGGAIAGAGWGEGLPQPSATQPVDRSCPRCRSSMAQLHYAGEKGELDIDYCEGCSGMWLAQGALPTLRALAGASRSPSESTADVPPSEPAASTTSGIAIAPTEGGSGSGRGAAVGVLLFLAIVGGAAYFIQQHRQKAPSATSTVEPENVKRKDTSVAASALFTAVPALQEYYRQHGRWPAKADELDQFAVDQHLAFRLSDFAQLSFQEKKNGGLVLQYTVRGGEGPRTFHLGPPVN